ncbi:hypothetical protein GGQ65_006210 [Rhizobium fabae]|uniref:Uncharacterized protein n=1 Tax=Rhizobium fabae TaxID=573179 RepID=A0A7W6BIB7_9HYPH|nr:hypothetical protein [Rhizobium fabae]
MQLANRRFVFFASSMARRNGQTLCRLGFVLDAVYQRLGGSKSFSWTDIYYPAMQELCV